MRLYEVTEAEIEEVIRTPVKQTDDGRGNLKLIGCVGDREFVVVIAGDAPNLVITTFELS
jgi:hypothetical protein